MGTTQSADAQNNNNNNNNNNSNNNNNNNNNSDNENSNNDNNNEHNNDNVNNSNDGESSIPSSPSTENTENHHHINHLDHSSPHHTPQLSNQPRSLELFHQQAIGAPPSFLPYYSRSFDEPTEYATNHNNNNNNNNNNNQVVSPIPSDGYRWRKYGQKNVRGYPKGRSYYKCTYPGCNTKKTVNMSDGTIKEEISYRGEHNHAPPVVTRLNASDQESFKHTVLHENSPLPPPSSLSISFSQSSYLSFPPQNMLPSPNTMMNNNINNNNNNAHLNNFSNVLNGINPPSNATNPTLISTTTTVITQTLKEPEIEIYPYDLENQALKRLHTPPSNHLASSNLHESPPESPQQGLAYANGSQSSSTPRLVIETNVNVDHLDDGFHWRKYGQKTVKGSPYPRSYYKCTQKGCSVKKQVEQVGNTVVNSYDGTHTHAAPGLLENIRKKRKTTPRLAISNLTNNAQLLSPQHNHHADIMPLHHTHTHTHTHHHHHMDMNHHEHLSEEHTHHSHPHVHTHLIHTNHEHHEHHHGHHENEIEIENENENGNGNENGNENENENDLNESVQSDNENVGRVDCNDSIIHHHENMEHHEHTHNTYVTLSPMKGEQQNQVTS